MLVTDRVGPDHECDARIQRSLRNYLKTGVTLLTVAHRLPTIQDYDRVVRLFPLSPSFLRLSLISRSMNM